MRPSEISFNLGKYLLNHHFRDEDGLAKRHLFPQIQRIARRWIDGGYLVCKGVPVGAILYESSLAAAAQKIHIALSSATDSPVKAVLDPYNPKGSTSHVNFITSKSCWTTGARPPKSQISHVVLDSSWEEQLALTLENHPSVIAYAKNQAMGFEVPYLDGAVMRRYIPDFLVRLDLGGDEPLNLVLEVKGFRGEDAKIKAATMRRSLGSRCQLHGKLLRGQHDAHSNYANLVEGVFIAPSHLSVGIQFADMVGGAVLRRYKAKDNRFFDQIADTFRKSEDGRIEGFGLIMFPKKRG